MKINGNLPNVNMDNISPNMNLNADLPKLDVDVKKSDIDFNGNIEGNLPKFDINKKIDIPSTD